MNSGLLSNTVHVTLHKNMGPSQIAQIAGYLAMQMCLLSAPVASWARRESRPTPQKAKARGLHRSYTCPSGKPLVILRLPLAALYCVEITARTATNWNHCENCDRTLPPPARFRLPTRTATHSPSLASRLPRVACPRDHQRPLGLIDLIQLRQSCIHGLHHARDPLLTRC